MIALVMLSQACGWGDIEYITFSPVHGSDGSGTRTAIVAHYLEQQPPTGLGAFPDGGKPRERWRGVLLYYCDSRITQTHLLGTVEERDSDFNVAPAIGNWDDNGFVVAIGRATSPISYSMTRVSHAGVKSPAGVSEIPPVSNQNLAPFCASAVDSIARDIRDRAQDRYRRKP